MYLKYGNYQHATNEASVAISKEGLFSEAGIARGIRERWTIQGRLHAPSQQALTSAIAALTAAYSQQGQDVGFFLDDGTPSTHVIQSAMTNGGVRVLGPPSFPKGEGAEYSTFRSYAISLEAESLNTNTSLLSWHEVLSFHGGGQQFVYLEPINGPPQRQLLKQATTYRATQSGQAVGHFGYPLVPAPLWPDAEHTNRREIRMELPKRKGPPGVPVYSEYKISWSYSFESAGPLAGLPTAWPI